MQYNFRIEGNTIYVRVTDSYSVASGISRNDSDNVEAQDGEETPRATTTVIFEFKYSFPGIKSIQEE